MLRLIQTRSLSTPLFMLPLTHSPPPVRTENTRQAPCSGLLHWLFLCLNAFLPGVLRAPSPLQSFGSVGPSPTILSTNCTTLGGPLHPPSLHLYPQNSALAEIILAALILLFTVCPQKCEPPRVGIFVLFMAESHT